MVVRVGVRLARYVLHYKQLNQTLERPGLSLVQSQLTNLPYPGPLVALVALVAL